MAVRKTTKTAAKEAEKVESKFSKNQLLAAKRFSGKRDILEALLSDDETYTVKTVEQMIEDYMKGKVK
jgi:hypothetical protein